MQSERNNASITTIARIKKTGNFTVNGFCTKIYIKICSTCSRQNIRCDSAVTCRAGSGHGRFRSNLANGEVVVRTNGVTVRLGHVLEAGICTET